MKVLFMDIDGVLNSQRTCLAFGGYPHGFDSKGMKQFDWAAVALIRRLCTIGDIKIVLSSSWRLFHDVDVVAKGLDLPIIDKTGTDRAGFRGNEIQLYLDAHPEIDHYAIVDDNSDMCSWQLEHFVQTDPDNGLSFKDYFKLCDILRVPGEKLW